MSDDLLGQAPLDHVGVAAATHDLRLATLLGHLGETRLMPSGVEIARFGFDERFELVVPGRPGTPVERFLERRGSGLHHVALAISEPLAAVVDRLQAAGIETTGPIEPSSDGRPSVFLHPSATGGILVELVEGGRTV